MGLARGTMAKLETSSAPSTVERLAVEEVRPRPKLVQSQPELPSPSPPQIDLEAVERAVREAIASIPRPIVHPTLHPESLAMLRAIAAVIAASAAVLATRALLGAALLGVFVLAVLAVRAATLVSLLVLIAFAVLVMGPLAWLESRTNWKVGE
jgi:hypothetical protein